MQKLASIIPKAKSSAFWLWVFNHIMLRVIPFNKPHRFWITKITDTDIEIKMPYRNSNLNHIQGLHACGLATVAEYATGLMLISKIDPSKYRLIMQSLTVQYYYQAKQDVFARFSLSQDFLTQQVFQPLKSQELIYVEPEINIYDSEQNHICMAKMRWQIKNWTAVKTKV